MTDPTPKATPSAEALNGVSTYIRAKQPVVYVQSVEERRVIQHLSRVAEALRMKLQLWSITQGFVTVDGESLAQVQDPVQAMGVISQGTERCMYVMRDFHPFLDASNPANIVGIRALRELGQTLKRAPRDSARCVVIVSSQLVVPEDLRDSVVVVPWKLPDYEVIHNAAKAVVGGLPEKMSTIRDACTEEVIEAATRAAMGLTVAEAENAFSRSLVVSKVLNPKLIAGEKKQIVARGGVLEWVDPKEKLEDIGGYEVLKTELRVRKKGFSQAARDYGLPPTKGLLCVGVPGGGKSLTAKALSAAWERPLLRFDIGKAFGSLVGQSEEQARNALQTAEACAPCILWCDEIEKGFGGTGAQAADGGTSARVFGTFLTWMQEKEADVVVYATANDVSALPPELLRKGRFDEVFFVDLPNTTERVAIWNVHSRKYGKPAAAEHAAHLARITPGFTGAEIEAALVSAMFKAFADDRETGLEDIQLSIAETVPLSKTAGEKIDALRAWAKGRARFASLPESAEESQRQLELDDEPDSAAEDADVFKM